MIDAVSKLSLAVLGLAVIFVWFLGSPASDTAQMHQGTIAMTGLHWTSNLIAGPLVRQLLSKGYSVRGVVPNLNDPEAMAQAHKMFPKVEWYEADLLQEGSLQPILDGCQHVVHMAQVVCSLNRMLGVCNYCGFDVHVVQYCNGGISPLSHPRRQTCLNFGPDASTS